MVEALQVLSDIQPIAKRKGAEYPVAINSAQKAKIEYQL